jgi:16S rRNA (guanine966-N2)-methyltransferase
MARAVGVAGAGRGLGQDRRVTRIVSGIWRGRRLTVPGGGKVRPTAERVREAWLSIVAPDLQGARVLDLFAGTGALGLEALSRGATHATFVELHHASLEALGANIAALDAAARTTVRKGDAMRYVAGLAPVSFDLVLADPPFATDHAQQLVAAWQAVPFGRLLAVEHDPRTIIAGDETRRWGDVAVTFLRAP